VLIAQGRAVAEAIWQIGVTEVAYYRWRHMCGGFKADQLSGRSWRTPDRDEVPAAKCNLRPKQFSELALQLRVLLMGS
jgi:hypothetical protein